MFKDLERGMGMKRNGSKADFKRAHRGGRPPNFKGFPSNSRALANSRALDERALRAIKVNSYVATITCAYAVLARAPYEAVLPIISALIAAMIVLELWRR